MKKKSSYLSEKVCVTVSSKDCAHRAPVSFTVHRGVMLAVAVLLTVVVAFCTYTAVNALTTARELADTANALQSQIEQQSSEISQYEQQISAFEQIQQ